MIANKSLFRIFSLFIIIVLFLVATPLQAAHAVGIVRYAKPAATGMGDCLSWANACTLQSALFGSAFGDNIWVMTGTHKPTTVTTERTATFQLKDGVALYSGFIGTKAARNQRNPVTNLTILSGDIDNNDDQTPIITDLATETHNGLNSLHVVTGATGATLDGFTQTLPLLPGSSAIDTGNDITCATTDQREVIRPQGAHCDIGAYEVQTILLVTPGGATSDLCGSWANACELRYALTIAVSGQEIWAAAGTYKPTAGTDRSATFQLVNGVAVYGGFSGTEDERNERDPSTNITILSGDLSGNDIGFANNDENVYHVVIGASGATLDGFTIKAGNANVADVFDPNGNGGGMLNNSGSSPTLTNIIFSGNSTAYYGGGMLNWNSSNPTLTNVTFSGNSAASDGGGLFNWNSSNPTLTNITFTGNSAMVGGGIYNYLSSNPTLTNVTISGNSATITGGGMYNYQSSPTLTNVTFKSNLAVTTGGGVYNEGSSNPQIRNTIFWGNTAASGSQISNSGSSPAVSDSVVQGGYTGTHIITTDPHLGTLDNYGGFTQTIPITLFSSAFNTGDDSVCPDTDQRGIDRPQGTHCDIGAFELKVFSNYLPLVIR